MSEGTENVENIKFTDDELDKLKDIRNRYQELVFKLGQVRAQQLDFEIREEQITTSVKELKKEEQTFAAELNTKYGAGSLDIQTGEFNPLKKQ
tara:strand:+ start:842 stop:1120 length:279 start_codon:yes stop_codon:yes gene_type:complete